MNKLAIFVILGLAAIASANVDVDAEISDLTLVRPLPPFYLRNATSKTVPFPKPATGIYKPTKPFPVNNKTNKTIKPFPIHINKTINPFPIKPFLFKSITNKTVKPFPVNNKTNKTVKPFPINNKTNKTVKPFPVRPLPVFRPNHTHRPFPSFNITNRSRTSLLHHFKNFTKVNTTKVFARTLPLKANTTEAVELFAKHIVNNHKNLTAVSTILQLVGELFLVGSQCEQDLGGAFYVASVVASDVEVGFKDIQSDVIASVFVGLLAYQATTDCPPVVQIIEELISIL